ncbi:MAG: choice-of-anchor J domain-containing protein, partial [candidate division Zixibacteria bacterium]|nr:choice-of-anchor J domain-containing protein [candidate division Zixibacteria bacterium]
MLNWRKRIPILVIALSILALGAIAFSGNSPEQEKAEAQAQENALRSVDNQATISADLAAKWAMEEEIAAKIAAEEEEEEEEIVIKEAYSTRDNTKGAASIIIGHDLNKFDPASVYFSEDFESETFPPTGWDTVNTDPGYGFFSGTYSSGTQAALVTWHAAGYQQDEWMISPSADLTGAGTDIRLDFWFLKGYAYPHEFKIYVATDGVTFNQVWDSDVEGAGYPDFTWTNETIDMSAYIGEGDVTVGFQYYGMDADLFGLDDVVLTDDAAATGRCCSGPDPYNPVCEEDVTLEYCNGVGGSWLEGGNCTDDPCPIPDENDECANVTPEMLPYTFMGNNEAATYDTECQYFGDHPNVWIAFEITECMDVTLTYCGCPAGWGNGWLNLITDCSCAEGTLISFTDYDFDCSNGNPQIYFDHLEAGTYYYPIMLDPGNGAAGDYVIEVTGEACPPMTPGDACEDPFVVNIGSGDLPYTIANQYTCGRQNLYSETCLGYYDGGEDLIVQLNLADDMDVNITLDPKGTTYSGMGISSACPDDAGECIASITGYSGDPKVISALSLTAGSYYIIVDTWPSPDCIPDLDIIIEEYGGAQEGDNCEAPIKIDYPGFPGDFGQTTCGRINDYEDTDLGYYDGGEDIIYEISVLSTVTVNVTLDPKGTGYAGMGLFSDCPPTSIIDMETGYSSDPKSMTCLTLEPGVYYLMVDTWPSPDCIPDFDLTITDTTCEALENDNCADAIPVGEVMDLAFSTDAATFDGGGTCLTSPNIWYCYTATQDGDATITLCGSDYDTKMAVYDGCSCDPLGAELGCNDDSDCDFKDLQSTVKIPVVAGNSYLVEVGGYSSSTGPGVLSIW